MNVTTSGRQKQLGCQSFQETITICRALTLGKRSDVCPNFVQDSAYKDIVAEVEAAITHLPGESKDQVRTCTTAILQKACLPNHKNITKEEKKALYDFKRDTSRVIIKADKGTALWPWIKKRMTTKWSPSSWTETLMNR